jgi:DNA-binding NtrC family response regulator
VLLAEFFARRFCCEYGKPQKLLAPGAEAWLMDRSWPGNVRELENLIHRAVALSDEAWLDPTRVDEAEREGAEGREPRAGLTEQGFREAKARAIAEFERAYIVELLARAQGNLSLAARLAGKERSRLGRLVKKHGLERAAFAPNALA